MNATQFAYAAARVRALEPKLLDSGDVERMLGAKTASEAYKILNDLEYATHIGDISNVRDFQEVITAGLKDSKEVLERICPDSRILDILFIRYDFHNIKTILKGMLAQKGEGEILSQLLPLGRVSIEDMMRFFYDEAQTHLPLPEHYAAPIEGWIKIAKEQAEPRLVDMVIDRAWLALTIDIANLTKNAFVIEYAKQLIDLTNIKTFLRIKLLKQESYFLESGRTEHLFAMGGHLAVNRFTSNLEADMDALANVFRGTNYFEIVQKGLEAFEKFKSFVYLEKYADEYLMQLAKKSRYVPFGPDALIAYFYAKQNNAQIIRMIMVGKLNGLPDDMLRERLHELY